MILVTGGTGLVGSHLLYYLTQQHDHVRATYRSDEKIKAAKHVFSYYTENLEAQFSKTEWIKATLNDIPKLTESFKGITHVYHCAALVSFDPNDYYILRKINIEGTANIVNLCISNGVKKTLTEETPWNPEADHSVYAITKYGAELEVWRGAQEGLETVMVNPGIIVGPGFWSSSSGLLFKTVHKGLSYFTKGVSGYIDIDDVVKPMIALMESSIKNERYILVAENLSFKSFALQLAKHLKVKPPRKEASKLLLNIAWRLDWLRYFFMRKTRKLTRQSVTSITNDSYYSNEKIISELEYRFKSIDASISQTCQFYLKDQASR